MKWVTEPPPKRTKATVKWQPIADELRAHPGEWALVEDDSHSTTANYINNGVYSSFRPAGMFEAVCRNQRLSRGELYVRYVGVSG